LTPLTYPAFAYEPEAGSWLVRFYDVPEAIAQGDTYQEAVANAGDALAAALEGYLEQSLDLPIPGSSEPAKVRPEDAAPGFKIEKIEVAAEPLLEARLLLARTMAARSLTKVDVASAMGRDEKTVRRILGGHGASFALTIEALRALGVRTALAA
jgi:antitoxin HicB